MGRSLRELRGGCMSYSPDFRLGLLKDRASGTAQPPQRASPLSPAAGGSAPSIPQEKPLIYSPTALKNKLSILLLETHSPMMLLLVFDVFYHGILLSWTDRTREILTFPSVEHREVFLVRLHELTRGCLHIPHEICQAQS